MSGFGRQTQVSPAFEVFLSSTIEDWKDIRGEISKRMGRIQIHCPLPGGRGWFPTGHRDVVVECRERVYKANAFLLLVGHWYGSIPDGRQESVTHLEYKTAQERWGDRNAPIAVILPKSQSRLDEELRGRASEILREKGYPPDHAGQLQAFRDHVTHWKYCHHVIKSAGKTCKSVRVCNARPGRGGHSCRPRGAK
ncbi:MAG: DUF4062 domain-containing protein [Bryobacteraceae bacterium]|nr:DUF4062 domain-containing protein [Bryobacteraceae bacterium]